MKHLLGLTTLLISAFLINVAGQSPATFLDHTKVAEAIAKGGVLTSNSDFRVQGGFRTTPSEVEVHNKETDIIYVTDGEATYVTGGTMIGGKVTAPDQLRGTSIQGGDAHHLTKGDVIAIPAGTPHWTKEVRTVSFYIVKVLPGVSGAPPATTYLNHEKVTGCAKAATLLARPEYSVICYNRSAAGGAEVHAGFTHIWYIVDGEATLVTGGTVLESRVDSPGEIRGSAIQGGETHHLTKGDVIAIPAGVPHWYKEVTKPVAYYSVNVEKK